jgi:DmsE family decaheme c-type cytochrome
MLGQAVVELCLKCHPAERADFGQVSHHPVLEERLHCAACHNPMGAGGEKMIQVQREQAVGSPSGKEVDDLCLSCHAEKGGPFLYEHDPLSGGLSEGCLTCHLPHGAPHDQLLRANVRGLCLRCHSDIATHPQFSFMTGNCLRCHTRIHGSNTDPRLLR